MTTTADLWDGSELNRNFSRSVSPRLMQIWHEVCQISQTTLISAEEDSLVSKFTSLGLCSTQTLYKLVNNRGVMPVYLHSVWKIKVPPRVHIFLWLLSKNKILTRDNLQKKTECP